MQMMLHLRRQAACKASVFVAAHLISARSEQRQARERWKYEAAESAALLLQRENQKAKPAAFSANKNDPSPADKDKWNSVFF